MIHDEIPAFGETPDLILLVGKMLFSHADTKITYYHNTNDFNRGNVASVGKGKRMLREHRNTKPSGINSPDQPQSPENRWNYHIRSHRMIPTAVFYLRIWIFAGFCLIW